MAKYFKVEEFKCKCCGHIRVDMGLIEKLDKLREEVGMPIIVNSGYRCASHNRNVGGSPTSQHLEGKAADILVKGGFVSPKKLAAMAEKYGFGGIGIYDTFIHVDTRAGKTRW